MAISTNSIIHYTDSFKTLNSILIEGFKITYCSEKLKLGSSGSSAAHPIISFCDIPLSDSKQHFDAYGKYGIGLSKQWAMKKGVNPVLYIDKNSLFARSLYELIKERRKNDSNLTAKQKIEILQIKAYAKNYSGPLKRKSAKNPNYKFYDEREWRLVPKKEEMNNAPFSISPSDFIKDKAKYNSKIADCRFRFEVKDISYIILKSTTEIPDMVNFLRTNYSNRCTARELDVLLTKICSTERIIADY